MTLLPFLPNYPHTVPVFGYRLREEGLEQVTKLGNQFREDVRAAVAERRAEEKARKEREEAEREKASKGEDEQAQEEGEVNGGETSSTKSESDEGKSEADKKPVGDGVDAA